MTTPGIAGARGFAGSSADAGGAPERRRVVAQDADARHQAWLRALEDAAIPSWFRGGDRSSGPAAPPVGAAAAPARARIRPAPAVWTAASTPALPPATRPAGEAPFVTGVAPPSAACDALAFRLFPPLALPPGVDGLADLARVLETAPAPARAASPASAGASAPRAPEPVRVHAEWTADGVRVWLGVDEGAAPVVGGLEPLVRELRRRIESSGARVTSVVCNGRVLFDRRSFEPQRQMEEGP